MPGDEKHAAASTGERIGRARLAHSPIRLTPSARVVRAIVGAYYLRVVEVGSDVQVCAV